ncbi:NAD-dependent succinate-semialdehyde dehydrogenase [Gluconacetobacter diazotrophicus]|uniref:Succinate-semialdehyde dehydrogenase [NADP+] n=1 Tax=Gluconacetobacter diazotrophicus (strain ATCC 49037 / DSM 5601 / CCUG 37298 / CIP 103539 / LMG 7603 / PAl5) TaxID=272568 RepID=A9HNC1_GLUDA|nr:NAD-dependent succinate-semialdehyde dehydrogenase [Gluconacetobacter diazotrophicus]CAP56423.1 Succinate-semialdehyde dehydrogenase [NADP+] [Gluconacetobacter diazotrophicus PA1 5]
MSQYPETLLFIDGQWIAASDGRFVDVVNPATEQVIGRVAHAGQPELAAAAAAAGRGFAVWSRMSVFDRYRIMRQAATLLRERVETVAPIMTMEQGKPVAEARTELLAAADTIDWLAEEGRRAYGRLIPARAVGVTQAVIRTPVGPVAAFSPWNFPVNQVVRKVGAALATGCSIIVKAAEETPASPAALVRAFADAGVPAGVIGLVYGTPSEISETLIAHPAIRKVTFTGSTAVGKMLAALAGSHMKRATMELGGHGPAIVCADADLDRAATTLVAAKFRNAGQVCVSPTRFLVERPVFGRFVERFAELARKVQVGDGLQSGTTMGPLANVRRVDAMEALIGDATARGAEIVTGGQRVGNAGYFFAPTVLRDLTTEMRIMNEDPFGPVALMVPGSTRWPIACGRATRLPYGLAAYAFPGSGRTAARLRDEVRTGMLTVNHLGLGLPEVPFGGIGDSGYGSEGGTEALDAYLDTRFFSMRDYPA